LEWSARYLRSSSLRRLPLLIERFSLVRPLGMPCDVTWWLRTFDVCLVLFSVFSPIRSGSSNVVGSTIYSTSLFYWNEENPGFAFAHSECSALCTLLKKWCFAPKGACSGVFAFGSLIPLPHAGTACVWQHLLNVLWSSSVVECW
jgi:hypothetical protein